MKQKRFVLWDWNLFYDSTLCSEEWNPRGQFNILIYEGQEMRMAIYECFFGLYRIDVIFFFCIDSVNFFLRGTNKCILTPDGA